MRGQYRLESLNATPIFDTGLPVQVAGIGAGSWSAVVAMVLPAIGHMFDVRHHANAFLVCRCGAGDRRDLLVGVLAAEGSPEIGVS